MRSLSTALAILLLGAPLCLAQPGSGADIMPSPQTTPSDSSDTPGIDEYVPAEQDPEYDQEDLRRRIGYPPAARDQAIQGTVVVRALVSKSGRVDRVVIDRSDNRILEEAAVTAVRETPFTPALQNGRPVAMWKQIELEFQLSASAPPAESTDNGTINPSGTTTRTIPERAQSAEPPANRFDQEHGQMAMRLSINGTEGEGTYVWDRYGQRTTLRLTLQTPEDSAMTLVMITANGYRTSYTTTQMGVIGRRQKRGAFPGLRNEPDIQSLVPYLKGMIPPEMLHPIRSRTIAGQKAEGVEVDTMGVVMRVWSKGTLVLGTELSIPSMPGREGMEIRYEATSLDLKQPVPASTFAPPTGATIIDEDDR